MPLLPLDSTSSSHLSALVDIWNAACGADLGINSRLVRYNTQPATGAIQAGRMAQRGDATIGFVLASALPNDPLTSPPEIGWIDAIAVLPELQRQGVGGELLNWAEGWLFAQGCAAARLGSGLRPFAPGYPVELGNEAFFRTRGYVERAEAPIVWDVATVIASTFASLSVNSAKQHLHRTQAQRGLQRVQVSPDINKEIASSASPPRNDISIRPAQPGDQDALLDFLRREFPGRWRFEFEEFLRARGRISDYVVLMTERGIDGFASLTFEDSERPIERLYMHRLPRPWGQIGPIGISASYRGRGLGAMLLDAALAEMKSRGVRGCVIDWTDLLDYYRKFGFEPHRQYLVMSKSLATRTAPATGSSTSVTGAK